MRTTTWVDKIVVFDEAHNVIDCLAQMYSVEMTQGEMEGLAKVLAQYLERYEVRLKPGNSLHIRQLLSVFKRILGFIKEKFTLALAQKSKTPQTTSHQLVKFLCSLKLEDFNYPQLSDFVTRSQMCKKLLGFSKHLKESRANWSPGVVYKLKDFLDALAQLNEDGVVLLEVWERLETCAVKFQLLNVQRHFDQILQAARCTIFIGGTMEPVRL